MNYNAWAGLVDDLRTTAAAIREFHSLLEQAPLVELDCLPLILDDRLQRIGERAESLLQGVGQGGC